VEVEKKKSCEDFLQIKIVMVMTWRERTLIGIVFKALDRTQRTACRTEQESIYFLYISIYIH